MTELEKLCAEMALCRDCDLAKTRNKVVPGEGREDAKIVFIGEAPGWHENQQGRPFVGPAGHFLEDLLGSIGLQRQDVYICNVVKCRPPENRDPFPLEIRSCAQWLDQQLELINPKVIVTLGRYSMARFFPGESIGKIHGTARKVGEITCFAMYHPAAALHQQSLRKVIEADMLKLPGILAELERAQQSTQREEIPPKQLSLF
ncbi:MAG: uracil-DNA glycosylase [Chloroflexota bacterium]|nr:MAG: uracil-DNA glycosylase [Chloroflexota bacterium]